LSVCDILCRSEEFKGIVTAFLCGFKTWKLRCLVC